MMTSMMRMMMAPGLSWFTLRLFTLILRSPRGIHRKNEVFSNFFRHFGIIAESLLKQLRPSKDHRIQRLSVVLRACFLLLRAIHQSVQVIEFALEVRVVLCPL